MMLKIGLVQMQMAEDPAANMARAVDGIREAARDGAEVVCLPELFLTRYFAQTEDADFFAHAEPIPGPSTEHLAEVAAELDVTLVASLFERRAPGLYHNTAAVIDRSNGYVGKYRKMHIPDDPRYYEKYYFTPGDLGFRTFDTLRGKLGVLICWDQWYPEAARLTAMQGAEILFYPTAIGWHLEEKAEYGEAQREAWITAQRAHAIANGCFVAAVNRVGFEPDPTGDGSEGIQFWGSSFLVAPDGSLLARLPDDAEAVEVVACDRASIAELRHGWPFFRDRRIDAYDGLVKRFGE